MRYRLANHVSPFARAPLSLPVAAFGWANVLADRIVWQKKDIRAGTAASSGGGRGSDDGPTVFIPETGSKCHPAGCLYPPNTRIASSFSQVNAQSYKP